ncbi:NYN domain-containing protein [Deinococcus geothermalis]|uniref:NYN domain-containing protein n=1 Tax=Deinococcus geothermalis TaxID=68909 RepID=UPI0023576792|nr:NYN domain-containing protein [Deinococcus geothermalis]
MKRTAVLIDGGFLLPQLKLVYKRHATAAEVYNFAMKTLEADEELFRMYYYDCPPYEGTETNPIDGSTVDFSASALSQSRRVLLRDLSVMDHVAFRRGQLSFDGWQIKRDTARRLMAAGAAGNPTPQIQANDVYAALSQKRVDMNIGLDVAWLSSKRIVDRIILVTADSDFIPAMKFARREGVQIILVPMKGIPKFELKEHADVIRAVTP